MEIRIRRRNLSRQYLLSPDGRRACPIGVLLMGHGIKVPPGSESLDWAGNGKVSFVGMVDGKPATIGRQKKLPFVKDFFDWMDFSYFAEMVFLASGEGKWGKVASLFENFGHSLKIVVE